MSDKKVFSDNIDVVTVGERGQVVIPASIRQELSINAGDRLMVMTKNNMVGFVPASQMESFIKHMSQRLERFQDTYDNINTPDPKGEKRD